MLIKTNKIALTLERLSLVSFNLVCFIKLDYEIKFSQARTH